MSCEHPAALRCSHAGIQPAAPRSTALLLPQHVFRGPRVMLGGTGWVLPAPCSSKRVSRFLSRTFCPGQNKVPDSERFVPRASHGSPLLLGLQRLSKKILEQVGRVNTEPELAPYQGTEFCLRIHHLNFVSGKHNTSTGPFLSTPDFLHGEHVQPRTSSVNIWGGHRQKLALLSSLSQWVGSHWDGDLGFGSRAAQNTAHKYLCSF